MSACWLGQYFVFLDEGRLAPMAPSVRKSLPISGCLSLRELEAASGMI